MNIESFRTPALLQGPQRVSTFALLLSFSPLTRIDLVAG